jgi:hypothetical protein
MSWLYSQALVEAYSEDCSSAGVPSARLSEMPMPQAYCAPDRMTAFSRCSRFGMTCEPLTDDHGGILLTWYLAGFPARTSAEPEKGQELTEIAAGFGGRWRELSVRYDPVTSSWKTHRCLWDEDLSVCSLTLPTWGSMRDGVLLERMTLALPTGGSDVGLWPTPVQSDWKGATSVAACKEWKTRGKNLPERVLLANAAAACFAGTSSITNTLENTAVQIVKGRGLIPTPSATDFKGSAKNGQRCGQLTDPAAGVIPPGGRLNPTWVEWLMGWPLGWTDLSPLATARSHSAPRLPGAC